MTITVKTVIDYDYINYNHFEGDERQLTFKQYVDSDDYQGRSIYDIGFRSMGTTHNVHFEIINGVINVDFYLVGETHHIECDNLKVNKVENGIEIEFTKYDGENVLSWMIATSNQCLMQWLTTTLVKQINEDVSVDYALCRESMKPQL